MTTRYDPKLEATLFDIIPDIHGQFEKLEHALTSPGYARRNGAWRHADPARIYVFLGDFIDRGPRNGDVITLVREMLDAGTGAGGDGLPRNRQAGILWLRLEKIEYHGNQPALN